MEEVRANPNPVETPHLPLVFNPFEFGANPGLGHFWKFNPDMGYFFRTCVKFTKTQVPLEYLVHSTFQRVKHFFSGFGVLLLL